MTTSNLRRTHAAAAATLLAALLALPADADAQGKGRGRGGSPPGLEKSQGIPPGHLPPPGMCRVWVEGTPPGRQAEPVDCPTAYARVADLAAARVIVGRPERGRQGGETTCSGRRVRYPSTAPDMRIGARVHGGERVGGLRAWGLPGDATVGITDRAGDGSPDTVSWRYGESTLQVWRDFDNDGRADMIEVYCDGERIAQLRY